MELHLLQGTAQKMSNDRMYWELPICLLKVDFRRKELCRSSGYLLGWLVTSPIQSACSIACLNCSSITCHVQDTSARMKSLFLFSVCSLCRYAWIVIRSVLHFRKKIDGDSEACHYKSWFLIIMALFWTLFSSPLFRFFHQNWTQCSKVLLVPNTTHTHQPFQLKLWPERLHWVPMLRARIPAVPSVHRAPLLHALTTLALLKLFI